MNIQVRLLFLLGIWVCLFAVASAAPKHLHIPGTGVEMPYLIAPMTMDGKLVSYAYISSRIIATSPSAAIDVRERTPFIQDAYVRDVNAAPIGQSANPLTVDRQSLVNRLLADARRMAGPRKVDSVELIQIQIAELRPPPHN
jgi:hypothetical protein